MSVIGIAAQPMTAQSRRLQGKAQAPRHRYRSGIEQSAEGDEPAVKMLDSAAKNVPTKQIEEAFGGSYGIYGGKPKHQAVLRFSHHASRWVSDEEWHPDQVGEFDAEGRYVLKIPYADPTELLMDILRQGHHVEVLAPAELRREIQKEAELIMGTYK